MLSTKRQGFTLIELMLAMSFIGILLIAMAVSIINLTHLYSKGITIKSVNQAGRDLGVALRRDAANISVVTAPIVQPSDSGSGGLGRLCLGNYSYIWNSPDKLASKTAVNYADATTTPIVLARVVDGGGSYCQAVAGVYPVIVTKANATEMLPADNGDYALRSLTLDRVPPIGSAAKANMLYDLRYTIGTNEQGTIDTLDQSCKPPSAATGNFNFCSVNTFELIVRAG